MVTAVTARYCLITVQKSEQQQLGPLRRSASSSSGTNDHSKSKLLSISSKHSFSSLDYALCISERRDQRANSSRPTNGGVCLVRAVLAESSTVMGHNQAKHEAEIGSAPTSDDSGARSSLSTSEPEMGLVDSSIESTLEHRLWLGFGMASTVGMVAKAVLAAHSVTDDVGIGLGAVGAYILADLGTGFYHWGIDNYGDAKTPVFGLQIDAFQGHHKRPWTIAKREFANNLHAIARPVGFFLLPFLMLPSNSVGDAFLGFFLGLVIMSQQLHAWAHSKKSQLPALVNFLQETGILISRKMHGAHHRAPYSINYCIVSGLWNPILNESKFFARLEAAIYSRWGVAPRCWADEVAMEWLQEGSYFEDGSDVKLDQEG